MKLRIPGRLLWNVLVHHAPIQAQLIITRRCNLSCGYCTEYDSSSPPVPLEVLKERIDALIRLRVCNIALLGGEPLLHPDLCEIVSTIRPNALVSVITNGFLLTPALIEGLNDAGLDHLQISIDALSPSNDLFIQKSLKSLRGRLRKVKELARFSVHVNAVLCPQTVEEFTELVDEIRDIGFPLSVGIVHDPHGHLHIAGELYQALWKYAHGTGAFTSLEQEYGERLLNGEQPDWQCRAGGRYLYIDETGFVQYCSAQRGRLNKDVRKYTVEDLRREGAAKKGCEAGCTISCALRCSFADEHPVRAAKDWFLTELHAFRREGAELR